MGEEEKSKVMERILERALLYDFYGELLTEHQKELYEEVVLDDCSLSEVAEKHGISRQGVHDIIKRCDKILSDYEQKLHLVEKFMRAKVQVKRIHELAASFQKNPMEELILQIQELSNEILKEF